MKIYVQKRILFSGVLVGILCLGAGCAAGQGEKYTLEELGNLAEIRVYTAEDEELVKTVTDEELLYQYNQCSALEEEVIEEQITEERQTEIKKALEGVKEQYHLVSYKYPAARFGKKDLEKLMTLTLYENENIIKMTVADESIKAFSLPEEFLTFYYEISEEEMKFYQSLAE